MKKRVMIIGIVTILSFFVSLTAFANDAGMARLSLIEGDILMSSQDTDNEWVAASINVPLMSGDKIWVPRNGRMEIQFIGRSYLRADENSEVTLRRASRDGAARIIQIALPEGRAYVYYRSASGSGSVFQVDTPLSSVMAYENAQFDICVREDGYTQVSVLSGVIFAESPYGTTRISAGNMISIGADDYAEVSPLGPRGEWIRWNQTRDASLGQSLSSSRYLPPELHVFSGDFDNYGRWIYTRDYGYVWSPSIVVRGWAPYRHGRWVWMRGDYVWISYEPWGWAPYHYGRWAFRIGIGWFWVPPALNAVFWAPGFVAWIYGPSYVSWVPLAPGEIYYGYGYYGPYSVNLTKVNITNIQITNVYVNARVTNAVTIVHRDTFLTGKPSKFDGKPDNPFTKGVRGIPGRPDIKPAKTTALPLPDKAVLPESMPSPRLIEKVKKTGIQDRPLAADRTASVFKREKAPTPMPVMKMERQKPVSRDERRERKMLGIPEHRMPDRMGDDSRRPSGRTIERPFERQEKQMEMRQRERKPIDETPFTPPRHGSEKEQIRERDAGSPHPIYPPPKDKEKTFERGHRGAPPFDLMSIDRSPQQKGFGEKPSVSQNEETRAAPANPHDAGKPKMNLDWDNEKRVLIPGDKTKEQFAARKESAMKRDKR